MGTVTYAVLAFKKGEVMGRHRRLRPGRGSQLLLWTVGRPANTEPVRHAIQLAYSLFLATERPPSFMVDAVDTDSGTTIEDA